MVRGTNMVLSLELEGNSVSGLSSDVGRLENKLGAQDIREEGIIQREDHIPRC